MTTRPIATSEAGPTPALPEPPHAARRSEAAAAPYATDHPTRLAALWAARDAAQALGPRVKFVGVRGVQRVLTDALNRGEDMNRALHAWAAPYDAIVVGVPTGYLVHSCAAGFGPVVRYTRIPPSSGALPRRAR